MTDNNAAAEAAIIEAVLGFIAEAPEDDAAFEALALRLFAYQYEHNPAYRRFAASRGRTPRLVRRWQDIPAVPISAFKQLTLSCRPEAESQRVFMTSGTTGAGRRGEIHHTTLAVYDASMLKGFRRFFMPEGVERLPMALLFPPESELPNSSLAHYLALASAHCGTPDSRGFLSESGFETEALLARLRQAEASGEPFALLGASYAFVHLMDWMAERGFAVTLPEGSRILDTGGFKGRSREVALDEFYDRLSASFGVPRRLCINMYGMTELSTQLYDAGNETVPSLKRSPPWLRTRVVDPLTGESVPQGTVGVLVHHDLAHVNPAAAILTEDAGIAEAEGFRLLGRADGAEAKGCSMAVAEFLAAAAGAGR